MTDKNLPEKKAITLNDSLSPIPANIVIHHVDSKSSVEEHVDADSHIMTTQLAMLMQAWPRLDNLNDICTLSDQLMKVLKVRRELCLKPTSKADMSDGEIDVTPA